MTFLPIVARELRVAARRRGTHWTRLLVALLAILTGIGIFLGHLGSAPHVVGQSIFLGLAILCMSYCVLSGRISTADCLSEEKREGTLGLLFLTDLKGYDIVLGKLVSTSLGALYGLLAVMPVLAVPLLMGGVTSGEFWRVVLVLVNTFLFSLAIGIFGSSISRDARRAMAANFALLLLFMVVLPLGKLSFTFLAGGRPSHAIVLSPFYSFYLCQDTHYKLNPGQFWCSTCLIAALSLLLLALASLMIPQTWQDKPHAPARGKRITWRGFWNALSYGNRAKLEPYRKRLLDINAFYWLAARARLKPLHVWIFLGLMAFWWVQGWLNAGMLWFDPVTAITLAVILNCTLKAWITLEAGQQLAEDQKAGALELLLATPLTVRDILRGQFLALCRQFLKPLLLTIAVELILLMTEFRHAYFNDRKMALLFWLAGIAMLVADVLTLPVVAMRVALTAKNPARATLSAIARVLVLPWILFGLVAGIVNLWVALELLSALKQVPDFPGPTTCLGMWFGIGIAVDLFFGLRAWRQLLGHFRELATWRFAPPPPRAARRLARQLAQSAPRFSARKKALVAGVALTLLVTIGFFALRTSEPVFPPPLVVSITQSNAPLRVFADSSVFMILPDGSLWHWGTDGNTQDRIVTPEHVGTNDDWLQVSGSSFRGAGLRQNGTLWQWGQSMKKFSVQPGQVDSAKDWTAVSTGDQHSVALKKDGTLWAWGENSVNQLGNGPGPKSDSPVQVGSDSDWKAVLCQQVFTLGLKTNGTLWIWGQTWGQNYSKAYPTPTLFCRDTNWTALGAGFGAGAWARNSSGEVWQLTLYAASPTSAASATGELLASNSLPGHLIVAYDGKPELYELRGDGTLWEKPFSVSPMFIVSTDEQWRQVGKRSDWQAIWGSGITGFGLTADGTLWTWGIDPSRNGSWSLAQRLHILQIGITELFASGPARRRMGYGAPPAIQKNPRPLLRVIVSQSELIQGDSVGGTPADANGTVALPKKLQGLGRLQRLERLCLRFGPFESILPRTQICCHISKAW